MERKDGDRVTERRIDVKMRKYLESEVEIGLKP